jgi:hypothetical protein
LESLVGTAAERRSKLVTETSFERKKIEMNEIDEKETEYGP